MTVLRRITMTENLSYLRILPGKLKLITIAMSGLVVLLSYVAYFLSDYTHDREKHRMKFTKNELRSLWRELFLMGVSTICFIASVFNLAMYCRSLEFYWKSKNAVYDFLYHAVAAILLGFSGVLFIVSGVKIYEFNCTGENECQLFELKIGAGGLALLTSIMYGVTGTVVLTLRKDVEREAMMAEKNISTK